MNKAILTSVEIKREFPYVIENWGGKDILEKINWLNDTFGLEAASTLWEVWPVNHIRFKHEEHCMLYILRWS